MRNRAMYSYATVLTVLLLPSILPQSSDAFWWFSQESSSIEHEDDGLPPLPRQDPVAELGQKEFDRRVQEALGKKVNNAARNGEASADATVYTGSGANYASFPVQHLPKTIQQQTDLYQKYLKGCRAHTPSTATADLCLQNEQDRLNMNLRQPRMMQNYTTVGFKKTRAPKAVNDLLKQLWQQHMAQKREDNKGWWKMERWNPGSTYVNHWESPTMILPLARYSGHNATAKGAGHLQQQQQQQQQQGVDTETAIHDMIGQATRPILEKWSQQPLALTSVHGMRVYQKRSTLAPYVDYLPFVISAIIHVAHDFDGEPWPIELYAHDGKAYNVTLEPGEMLLYESHSIIHGRPYPLQGEYHSDVYVHFEPVGHSARHVARLRLEKEVSSVGSPQDKKTARSQQASLAEKFQSQAHRFEALRLEQREQGKSLVSPIPQHVVNRVGSDLEKTRWNQDYSFYKRTKVMQNAPKTSNEGRSGKDGGAFDGGKKDNRAHLAAASGDLKKLKLLAKTKPKLLTMRDGNGWQPLHEAARGGHVDVVEYLLKHYHELEANGEEKKDGRALNDVNSRTNRGKGASPLWWAESMHGENHPAAKAIRNAGGESIPPNPDDN